MYLKINKNIFNSKTISTVMPKDTNKTKKPGQTFI